MAIKVIFMDASLMSKDANSSRDRLQTLLQLEHEFLVAYHTITMTKVSGGLNIELLMDYCNGGDLAGLLEGYRASRSLLDTAAAIRYALDITQGLEYLHRENFVHGDLKPANVFVKKCANGATRLVIGDLDDLVKLEHSITCSRDMEHLRGTIRYMSPEMLRKAAEQPSEPGGRKTDIWSLGCVLLNIFAHNTGEYGMKLQKGDEFLSADDMVPSQFMIKIVDGFAPVVPDSIPANLSLSIRQCFSIAKEDRISAGMMLEDLLRAAKCFCLQK